MQSPWHLTSPRVPLSSLLLKLTGCIVAACLMSAGLFIFMQKLISQSAPVMPDVEFSGFVELFRPMAEQQVLDNTPPPTEQLSEPEPLPPSLNLASEQSSDIALPDSFQFSDGAAFDDFAISGEGLGFEVANNLAEDFGDDTQQGFIEITPFATRRPNIPVVAFENQLNGWVLVIFNVSAAGTTRNIKVLDASPKGIFEGEVVRAIGHWHYDVQGLIKNGEDLVLTQKIQLDWQNYHQNLPYDDER